MIISGYENKLSQNIASKTLSASKRGESPEFTKEELLYLNKKSSENDESELNIITPIPTVTLKKGRTELNIGHAAALVQKMEEKYPTGNKNYSEATASCRIGKPGEFEKQFSPKIYQSEVYSDSIPVKEFSEIRIPETKSPSRNAYEIREAILSHAISWIQYKKQFDIPPTPSPTEDDVLSVAQKFYKFVENKR